MIVELQCLPNPAGTSNEPYKHIDAAITVIQRAGLGYEIGALGTTVEGKPDELWALMRKVHEACLRAGAEALVTVIKVEQAAIGDGPTIASLTGKFRDTAHDC